jgi:RAD3-like DEAD/DEAH box helicase
MHWIERITTATHNPHHSTPTQILVRGQEEPSSHASRLHENRPSILIGTPQAILDVLNEDEHAIDFTGLSTVVVDEVDYIIDFIPADASKDRKKRLAAKMRRHPSAGKLLLDRIYSPRTRPNGSAAINRRPQLVVCSATLQTGLRQQLLYHSGWFRKDVDSVVKVRSELPAGETRKSDKKVAAADVTLDAEMVEHCALVFSEDGSVRDVEGAVEPKWLSEDVTHGKEVQTRADPQNDDLPKIHEQPMEGELAVYSSLQITELMVGFGSVRRACRNAFCLQSCCDGRGSGHICDSCSEDGIAYPASLCTSTACSARPTYARD